MKENPMQICNLPSRISSSKLHAVKRVLLLQANTMLTVKLTNIGLNKRPISNSCKISPSTHRECCIVKNMTSNIQDYVGLSMIILTEWKSLTGKNLRSYYKTEIIPYRRNTLKFSQGFKTGEKILLSSNVEQIGLRTQLIPYTSCVIKLRHRR